MESGAVSAPLGQGTERAARSRARTRPVGELLGDGRVRRVVLAFGAFSVAEYGVWVTVLVYAYGRGGATETALVAVAQLIPAGLIAPLIAGNVDRSGAAPALRRGYLLQAAALTVTSALLIADAAALLVYGAAALAACAVTTTRPAQAALVPELVDAPEQLLAINALAGWAESASILCGPALAGLLMGIGGPGVALSAFAACTLTSALLVAQIPSAAPVLPFPAAGDARRLDETRRGIAAVREQHGLGALIALLGMQYLVIGLLDVLLVVLAIDELALGASGAGYLNAAFGAGGVLGSIAALSLIARRRLSSALIAAAVGWGLALAILGAWPSVVGAFLLLAAAGTTRSLLDVAGRTLLMRAAAAAVRGRVFGLLEGVAMLGLALGSGLAPVLMAFGGANAALIATAVLLSAMALAAAARVHRVDAAARL